MQELREGMKSGIGVQCNRSKSENPTLGWKGHQLSWQTDCSISLDSWQTIKLASFSFLTTVVERSCLCSLPPDSQFFHAESLSAFFLLTPPWTTLGLRPFFAGQPFWTKNDSHHSPLNTKLSSVMFRCGLRLSRLECLSYYHISPCTSAISQRAELILSDLWSCFLYRGNDRVKIQTVLHDSSCTN